MTDKDILDQGIELLIAGLDIDPELLKEGRDAAAHLREIEELERRVYGDLLTKVFLGSVPESRIYDYPGLQAEFRQLLASRRWPKSSFVGTPSKTPNPFFEMWQMANKIGECVVSHGEHAKSTFEDVDVPVIVEPK